MGDRPREAGGDPAPPPDGDPAPNAGAPCGSGAAIGGGRPPAAARLLMAGMVVLLVHNLVLLVRNQLTFDRWHRVHVQSAPLGAIAADSRNPHTRYGVALYYQLRARMAGATLVIPEALRGAAWWLEHGARVRIELQPRAPALAPDEEAALRARADLTTALRAGERNWPLAVISAAPGAVRADRYVVVTSARSPVDLLIAPAPLLPPRLRR